MYAYVSGRLRRGIGKDKGETYNEWKRKWLSLVSEISIYQIKNSYHRLIEGLFAFFGVLPNSSIVYYGGLYRFSHVTRMFTHSPYGVN